MGEEPQLRRPTGKLGEVMQAISAEGGATLAEITTLTGWLPHTARAAVTGLRKRGFDVVLIQQGGRKAFCESAWKKGSDSLSVQIG